MVLLVLGILFTLPSTIHASKNTTQEQINIYKQKAKKALVKYYRYYQYKYYKEYIYYIKKCRIKVDAKLGLKVCNKFEKLAHKYDTLYQSKSWKIYKVLAKKFAQLQDKCQTYVAKNIKDDTTNTNTATDTTSTPTSSRNNTTTVTNN